MTLEGRARWAKPAEILEAELSRTDTVTFPDGRTFQDADLTLTDEDIERMKQGRMCFNCKEPLEVPFPLICRALKLPTGEAVGCGYRVREQQLRDLDAALDNRAVKVIDTNKRLNDEIERMQEMDLYESKHGVILPDSVKFPQAVRRNG